MNKAKVILSFMILIGFVPFKTVNASSIKVNILYCQADNIHLQSLLPYSPITKDSIKRKKLIIGLFAFPFPMGFMGAHRVVLGCKPWIPVVYMATFGGCFGLLPLIDCCVIAFSKDIAQYENNARIFMWIKE